LVPTIRPLVRAYASTAADWATTGATAGREPEPIEQGGGVGGGQVADGYGAGRAWDSASVSRKRHWAT
jgi:hypothetical protein